MAAVEPLIFDEVARVPAPGDNVAIALRTIPAGARILIRQLVFEFSNTVLEGHRFAIHRIRKGDPLLSWDLPFGLALRDIEPGEYVCNEKILRTLAERSIQIELPHQANFVDHRLRYELSESAFIPGRQVTASGPAPTFLGYLRNERRGAGTRNYIVVLGTSSRTSGFVRALAGRFKEVRKQFPNVDGVVPVAHTEGGANSQPRNLELTLRTLSGFVVNPNVAAVLCVDSGAELLSNRSLRQYLVDHAYPLDGLIYDFFSIGSSYEGALQSAQKTVAGWLPQVNKAVRERVPIRFLKLGLQCGGSDAFSGVSANPLVGILSRETVAYGGSANLAETDELIGAEKYVLQNVRDLDTAKAFLATLDRFQEWAGAHGHNAEGNPSGGNNFRGLYNITIKSIGAARKKDPLSRLDYVIDFGEAMEPPGFYFMNSPGNDLESIAGQVASGCNLILFATGNGSITNFPFVPTIKYMTTTTRFELVRNEMDFNAGRYLDGESLEALGVEALEQMLRIASGEPSAGECAGHSQVQLWREWRGGRPSAPPQTNESEIAVDGSVELTLPDILLNSVPFEMVGLVLPTSLCSGQIASAIAEKLNSFSDKPFARAIALPHTEGCGNCAGESEQLFLRTMAGYLTHPLVARAVLLEHGCEKTHNDAFRNVLRDLSIDSSRFGFASIQLDGGIERVTCKVLKQFSESPAPEISASPLSVGFVAQNATTTELEAIGMLAGTLQSHGITTVFTESLNRSSPKLLYGERFREVGVYSMETPTDDLVEIITGLAATGVQIIVTLCSDFIAPGNPLVPTIQVGSNPAIRQDLDLFVTPSDSARDFANRLIAVIADIRGGRRKSHSSAVGNLAFQITRGYTGISL